jgi:hypothetical protein
VSLRKFWLSRAIILPGVLFAFSCLASADVFDLSGTFGTGFFSGPLNGGSFSGSFTATLPITSGSEAISTYNIKLITSTNVVLTTLTGASAGVSVQPSPNCVDGSSAGACDLFLFFGTDGSFLELATPLDFSGGPVFPVNAIVAEFGSFAGFQTNSGATDSVVISGKIGAVPEPSSVLLLASAALGVLYASRKQLMTR